MRGWNIGIICDEVLTHCGLASIVSYMTKQSLPAVSSVNEENLEEIKAMDKIVVIGYIPSEDKETYQAFEKYAESQRDNYLFAVTNDPAIAKAEGVDQPSLVLYKDFDEKKAVYKGEIEQETIHNWVKSASTPLVGEIGPETYSGYIGVSKIQWSKEPRCEFRYQLLHMTTC